MVIMLAWMSTRRNGVANMTTPRAEACVYKLDGNAEDLRKAEAHAKAENASKINGLYAFRVYTDAPDLQIVREIHAGLVKDGWAPA